MAGESTGADETMVVDDACGGSSREGERSGSSRRKKRNGEREEI